MKKTLWSKIFKFVVAIGSAILGVIGGQAMG